MMLNIHHQTVGGLVATLSVFLQRLHHDPVQIPAHGFPQLLYRGTAMLGDLLQLAPQRRQLRRGFDRVLLTDNPLHLGVPLAPQVLRVKGGTPCQELIEQDAE